MNSRRRLSIKRWAILGFASFVAGLGFMRFIRSEGPEIDFGDVVTATSVALLLSASLLLIERRVLAPTRHLKLGPAVLIRAIFYTAGSTGSVFVGIFLANVALAGWEYAVGHMVRILASGEVLRACVYVIATVSILVFIGGISQKLGPGVLWNWLVGRYHEPREEHCVFLFLDLRDSTGLAERLGNLRFSSMVRDAFSDITPALLEHGARVSHFIGDEVVLYWPVRKGESPSAEFAHCFLAIEELLSRLAPKYVQRYGVVPSFKAGAHSGSVVVTDVGDIKSEIVFHGDVLNVASRLEGLCAEKGARLLVSGELSAALSDSDGVTVEDLGEVLLKGKEQPVRVFAVS